jgi:hypothetical protein
VEAANTANFISENDLPDWIRQIAEADAAKQAEEARLAAEAARRADGDAGKRVVLPGEQETPATVANPWLSRRDAQSATQAWGAPSSATVPAPTVAERTESTYEPVATEVDAEAENDSASKRGFSLQAPKLPSGRLSGLNLRGSTGDGSSKRSIYLVGGIILLLIVLLLML